MGFIFLFFLKCKFKEVHSRGKERKHTKRILVKTETGFVPVNTMKFVCKMGSVNSDDDDNALSTTVLDSGKHCYSLSNL